MGDEAAPRPRGSCRKTWKGGDVSVRQARNTPHPPRGAPCTSNIPTCHRRHRGPSNAPRHPLGHWRPPNMSRHTEDHQRPLDPQPPPPNDFLVIQNLPQGCWRTGFFTGVLMAFMTAIEFSVLLLWTIRTTFAFYRFLLFTCFAQKVADCSAPCISESVQISTFSESFLSLFFSLPP